MKEIEQYYKDEQSKWDRLIDEQYKQHPEKLLIAHGVDFMTYTQTDTLMGATSGIGEFLGDLRGKAVLDVGCGAGYTTALLAKSGASVTAFDISVRSVAVSRWRAQLNHLSNVHVCVAVGEKLPFPDHIFDLVCGRAVLHHLQADQAASELYRVLRPGGRAFFVEPMGMNPVLNFIRDHVPYPEKNPVGGDKPLTYEEIEKWSAPYRQRSHREIHFLGMLERAFPSKWKIRLPFLHRLDDVLLKHIPFLRRFSRYVVLYMEK